MSMAKRLEALECKAEALQPIQFAAPYAKISKEEWLALVAASSDFSRAAVERVIQQRATDGVTA